MTKFYALIAALAALTPVAVLILIQAAKIVA
jgi:hypothetical protein